MRNATVLFAFVLGGALALGSVAAAQTISLIPGTVNAGGLNNTRFVSDLALTNPGLVPVTAMLTLIPANGTSAADVTLNPGETVVYRNVLDSLWGAQGAGATQVIGMGPLLIRARTYNTAASGTYGVALPVFAYDRVLSSGDVADSLWVSQSADGTSGYRTNVAVVFPDAGGGAATVSVYDADGNLAGTQEFNLNTAGFQQFSVSSFAGAVPVGRAQIQVMGGHAAGYSVVVDNVTGDSSLFAFEDLPAGTQDVLVNGVARANGRNNTFFRTDGRFYNQGSSDATVSVAFHANQNTNSAPLTGTFTVPAGKIRDVVDVLDSLLGLPVGSAGALRFTSDMPVAILCRTSNVDPAGIKPGTFGAQQRPTPLLSFLMSADAGAVVTGIRQNGTFRTNVGFAAGPDGAAYSLTLKSKLGATVATATGSLGPFGWTQPNMQDLFPSTTIPEDATLLVKVTSGSVDVFDSSIDQASGDPVVTPIMPLPAEIPSSATIGPLGGSIRSSDGRLTLKVPAGALSSPADISFAPASAGAPNGIGPAYLLTVPPEVAGRALLVLAYFADEISGSGAEALSIAFKGGDGWYIGMGGSLDPATRTLVLPLLSISPPGSASVRTPACIPICPPLVLEILRAWTIIPEKWVLRTGDSVPFHAFYVGRPTTSWNPLKNYYYKATDPSNVNVIWSVRGGPGGGTITPAGTTGTYTAPCQSPGANPEKVNYLISDSRILFSPEASHSAVVHILPRYWVGEVDLAFDECGISGGGFYTYKNATINFSLDENLNVTGVVSGPSIAPTISLVPMCGNGDPCSYVPGPAAPDKLFVSDVKANEPLSTSYGKPSFSLMIRVPGTPEVTWTCGNGTTGVIPGSGQSPPIDFGVDGLHAPNFNTTDELFANVILRIRALPDINCE